MWPFSKKEVDEPDTRPPSAAAKAIAESLRSEPQRWKSLGDEGNFMAHDSFILVDKYGWTRRPNLDDEPDANADLVRAAIDDWVAKRVLLPIPAPQVVPAEVEQANG